MSNKGTFQGPLDYIDVATRIVDFREKHPEGSLQQVEWKVVEVSGRSFVVYTAAAYRTPDDARPGIGTAWEPVPGPTKFTRDSELQNAETSAWGRAIVAALAADTKHGIASSEDVRNRTAAELAPPALPPIGRETVEAYLKTIAGNFAAIRGYYSLVAESGAGQDVLDLITAAGNAAREVKA